MPVTPPRNTACSPQKPLPGLQLNADREWEMVVRSGRKLALACTPTSSSFLLPPTPLLQGPLPSFWTRNKGRTRYKLLARGHSNFQATYSSHFHDNPFPWVQSASFPLCHTLILHKHPTPSIHPQETQTPPPLPWSCYCCLFLAPAEWMNF